MERRKGKRYMEDEQVHREWRGARGKTVFI